MEYPLFTGYAIERKPFRPLGIVSDFVVEQLPKELTDIREGKKHVRKFETQAEMLVMELQYPLVFQDATDRDQALLDLLFIETGIAHSNGGVCSSLVAHIDKLAEEAGRIPALTYEDVIFVNLRNHDVRTFTSGDMSLSERDFYESHMRIENILENCIALCQEVISDSSAEENWEKISTVATGIEKIKGYTKELRIAMPKEHFSVSRQYFVSHPQRGFKGPSGAFSARFPILEVLLAGEHLPDETFQYYMDDNYDYLPRRDRLMLKDAFCGVHENRTVTQILQLRPQRELYEAVKACSDAVRRFRTEHYGAVRHHLPEVINGGAYGSTGEQDVGKFLRNRMNIRYIPKEKDIPDR